MQGLLGFILFAWAFFSFYDEKSSKTTKIGYFAVLILLIAANIFVWLVDKGRI